MIDNFITSQNIISISNVHENMAFNVCINEEQSYVNLSNKEKEIVITD